MSTELEVVSKALVDINAVSAGLAALSEQYAGVVYEVSTTKGMAEAKAARLAIREPRFNVESIRKAAKKPILDLGKKLDAEAARITNELLKLEEPIDEQIKAEEDRKEREKQERIEAEQRRVAAIDARIDAIRGWPAQYAGKPSSLVKQQVQVANDFVIDGFFEEKAELAQMALEASRAALAGILSERLAHEVEQERIKAEREELARLRAQQAQRDAEAKAVRDEEERQVKAERAREAALHAEQLRKQREEQEAEQRARQQVIDAENARIRAEQEAATKIERDPLAAERAELARQQEELRKAQAPPPPTRRGVAIQVPTAIEIVDVLAKHYRARPDTILDWLKSIDFSKAEAA